MVRIVSDTWFCKLGMKTLIVVVCSMAKKKWEKKRKDDCLDDDACGKVTVLVRNGGGLRGIYNDSLTNKTNTKWLLVPLSHLISLIIYPGATCTTTARVAFIHFLFSTHLLFPFSSRTWMAYPQNELTSIVSFRPTQIASFEQNFPESFTDLVLMIFSKTAVFYPVLSYPFLPGGFYLLVLLRNKLTVCFFYNNIGIIIVLVSKCVRFAKCDFKPSCQSVRQMLLSPFVSRCLIDFCFSLISFFVYFVLCLFPSLLISIFVYFLLFLFPSLFIFFFVHYVLRLFRSLFISLPDYFIPCSFCSRIISFLVYFTPELNCSLFVSLPDYFAPGLFSSHFI